MTNRSQQFTAALKRIGIASLVMFVGATARPVISTSPAHKAAALSPVAKSIVDPPCKVSAPTPGVLPEELDPSLSPPVLNVPPVLIVTDEPL